VIGEPISVLVLRKRGRAARMGMIPLESCPVCADPGVYDKELLDALLDLGPVGPKCPWCDGWSGAELELYEAAKVKRCV